MSLQFETFIVGPFPNNLYLVRDETSRQMIVIDPSIQSDAALARAAQLQAEGYTLEAIWNTHGHLDHVYDDARWKAFFSAPIFLHQSDVFLLEHLREQAIWLGLSPAQHFAPDHFLNAENDLKLGAHAAQVLPLPGHSPGSVAFYFAELHLLFSGDVLFQNSIGRTDLPGCNAAQLQNSLRILAALPPQTRVLSGHGEATTIGDELKSNPFLGFLRNSE